MKKSDLRSDRLFGIVIVGAIVSTLLTGHAFALSITNRDDTEHLVQVFGTSEDAELFDLIIAPGEKVDAACDGGCTVILESGDEMKFLGNENVFLQDRSFVHEP